ncbi:MAG: hypothetical protein JKY95_10955 [Planctomycetaceae bacterium]|nr:hypothetical protein [Planctomycetaceae bacterium]
MTNTTESILHQHFLNQNVVLDLQSMFVCLGKFVGEDHRYLILEDADVHDLRDTDSTRERYVIDSKIHGIRPNRAKVLINKQEAVGISLLDDVIA